MYSNLTGITLIRNGNKFNYPYKECIKQLSTICSEVIVNVGDSDDDTSVIEVPGRVRIFNSKWDMSNTGDGRELARQANLLLPLVTTEWILYLQADEFVIDQLSDYLNTLPINITQVELFRTYFYRDLNTRLASEELFLGRVFRRSTHLIGGDGMHLDRLSGDVIRTNINIYHYSRIGTEEQIDKRIKNLDRLFHEPEQVQNFSTFKYQTTGLISYEGIHPVGIKEFYDNKL